MLARLIPRYCYLFVPVSAKMYTVVQILATDHTGYSPSSLLSEWKSLSQLLLYFPRRHIGNWVVIPRHIGTLTNKIILGILLYCTVSAFHAMAHSQNSKLVWEILLFSLSRWTWKEVAEWDTSEALLFSRSHPCLCSQKISQMFECSESPTWLISQTIMSHKGLFWC